MSSRNEDLVRLCAQHVPQGVYLATASFVREARGAMIIDVDGNQLIPETVTLQPRQEAACRWPTHLGPGG